ncbi:RsmD family RNA methyltransferase [Olivibacter sp. SDN3]|uniref:RsmD family RNA methyltransferase n=1 Tax=Olivibacter sp. SDN3 TaxID=2764720 RepID=UPI0016518AF8|nr:RsmD family RNA methyltransferase [Olivibacter sp. SDN3]QNL48435.1 RsmD family RNA methyltransferase [Olivibacter sp. SDN3]
MRIIGGTLKGTRIVAPKNLPVRPTTDLAKEALFNILQYRLDWEDIIALDLFSGTGNITMELASRQVKHISAVDKHAKCCLHIQSLKKKFDLPQIDVLKYDVLKFLPNCRQRFDFIFADPPYDLPELSQIPVMIFKYQLLQPNGLFVLEHPSTKKINDHPCFTEQRKYGYSSFSFYEMDNYVTSG